jgi:capsular polysaccharide biosynthesis protein
MNSNKVLFSEHTVNRKLPINFVYEDYTLFEKEFNKFISAVFKESYKDVKITKDGVLFNQYKLVSKSVYSKQIYNKLGFSYRVKHLLLQRPIDLKNVNSALCFDSWYYGYFHWMTECMPRYFMALIDLSHDIYFVPPLLEGYHFESLIALGFQTDELYRITKTVKAENLMLYERLAPSGNYNESVIRKMSSKIKSQLKINDQYPKRMIYVSREKASRRKVINEDQIITILKHYGFEIICFEDYSFSEQVKLMAETKILISIHGAGLTNMMFMKPNTHVVEIRKEMDNSNLCYYSLANACLINYYYIMGINNSPNINVQNSNLWLSPDLLEELIKIYF